MPQPLVKVPVHIVFGTKERKNLIPQNRLQELWSYMGGIARNQKIGLIIAGGMRDHLHMVVEVPATRNLSDIIRTFTSNSSLDAGNESRFWLAERLWRFRRESVANWDGDGIHCSTTRAPQETEF